MSAHSRSMSGRNLQRDAASSGSSAAYPLLRAGGEPGLSRPTAQLAAPPGLPSARTSPSALRPRSSRLPAEEAGPSSPAYPLRGMLSAGSVAGPLPPPPASAGTGHAMEGSSRKARAILKPLNRFVAEPGADSFRTWAERMVGEVATWRGNSRVAAGVRALVARMVKNEDFRAECFRIARDARGRCADRPLAGYNHMQAALLASRAAAGELSTAGLHDASIRVFNLLALEAFASEHAFSQEWGPENTEVALYMETKLRDRLALPPNADSFYGAYTARNAKINAAVLDQAVGHVQKLHHSPESHGLPAFLAGQGAVEFNAWVEHLREKFPEKFEKLNQEVSDHQEARARHLGGTPAAREQAGAECKALWTSTSIDLVAQLTREVLPDGGAGGRRGPANQWVSGLRNALADCPSPWCGRA